MEKPLQVFCCYAREDQKFLLKLKNHLTPIQRKGQIIVQADIDVSPGEEWEQKITQYLNTAQIILLLISSDFMASDYCYSKEMMRAMERHEAGEARVIPIILRPVIWKEAPFGKLQALPTNAEAVTSQYWHTEDNAFFDVATGIAKAAVKQTGEKITFESTPALTPELEQELKSALLVFRAYMQKLGFEPQEGKVKISISISPDDRSRAFYDPYTHQIFIAGDLASKKDALWYQYAYHALLPLTMEDIADISATYLEIEAGLALYFVCSFNNHPLFLPKVVQASPEQRDKWDLSRLKKFQKVQPSGGFRDHDLQQAPWIETFEGDVWAAAFWQIRILLDQNSADKLLFAIWSDLQLSDFHSNNRVDFAKRLLKIAPYGSRVRVRQIQAIFERCGLKF